MADLVTLDQVKAHLRLPLGLSSPPSAEDVDLALKLTIAQASVLDYLKQRRDDDDGVTWAATVDAWTEADVPPQVQAAILMKVAKLYRFRGDDGPNEAPRPDGAGLEPDVIMFLQRFRDPALA